MTLALAEASRALREALGADQVRDGDSERDLHGVDLSFHTPQRPDLVVYPTSTTEVARVLAVADGHGIPVTPFGAGTSLEGHVIPVHGGISLDLTRLDRILELAPANLTATVQAGVTRLALQRAAGEHGLFFPVDPGADATLGGMAATNAAGTTTVRYGKMRANVLALEAVLPAGQVIRTGSRAAKTSAGYDLTGLLVGSEGTLAVITEVTRPAARHPRARRRAPDLASRTSRAPVAPRRASSRQAAASPASSCSTRWCVAAVNAFSGTTYPRGAVPVRRGVRQRRGRSRPTWSSSQAICRDEGATRGRPRARPRGAIAACGRHGTTSPTRSPHGSRERRSGTTDVCVPLTELAGAVRFARTEIERLGLEAGILGHAGDGNLHVAMQLAPDGVAASEELVRNIVDDALARGGTCTGEHGVGLGKIGALEREHGDLIPLMQAIKASFDPHGIMNPGKVLPPSSPAVES